MAVIRDISPPIDRSLAVYPGDRPYRLRVEQAFERGDIQRLGSFEATLHLGAHADAPNHYHPDGSGIDRSDLSRYLGPCQVVRAFPDADGRIRRLPVPVAAERVLVRTDSFPDPTRWTDGFAALSAELIDSLADSGVRLVGIDTPSVDPAHDPELPAHRTLFRRDMAVLEGLVLRDVPDGRYGLIALPLRLVGADASPVRAVLVDEQPLSAW